jgi:predicted dehydrogenase
MTTPKQNRRTFLSTSATALAGFYIVPRHVLGGTGYTAPSDRLNIAAIGAGGKGHSDIVRASSNNTNNIVALCDIDTNMAANARKDFPQAAFYKDFRKMLADMDQDIDAVTISTPDHNHGVAAMTAMRMQKHVYVQKPLTHNIYEARQLTEGARQHQVVSQMGNQGASNPCQEQMKQWFDQGLLGAVDTVHVWTDRPVWPQGIPVPAHTVPRPEHLSSADWDLFIGPAEMVDYDPLYHPFKWRGWWNFGTGALGDMGCHLIDIPYRLLQLGYPTEVECSIGQVYKRDWTPEYIPEGCPPSSSVQLRFDPSPVNSSPIKFNWTDGGIRPFHPDIIPASDDLGDTGSSNGVLIIGDKGVLTCGTYGSSPKLYSYDGQVLEMESDFLSQNSYREMPEWGHHHAWAEACKAGFGSKAHQSLTSSFDYAGPMTETVLMGNLAIRSYQLATQIDNKRSYDGRKKLIWDGENMEITNFDDANQFVGRNYRAGWRLV